MNSSITEHPTEPGEYIFTGAISPTQYCHEVPLKEVRVKVWKNDSSGQLIATAYREAGTISDDIEMFVGGWKKSDDLPKGKPAHPTPTVIDRSEDPWKPFTPCEPDWKRLYYSLSVKVIAAHAKLENGKTESALQSLERGVNLIEDTERKIELCESIVSVQTTEEKC